jgi:hypothetical protein
MRQVQDLVYRERRAVWQPDGGQVIDRDSTEEYQGTTVGTTAAGDALNR